MNGTWTTPAGTLSLDGNSDLWITSNGSNTPALEAQNVESVKAASASNIVAFTQNSGVLDRFDTALPALPAAQLATNVGSYAVSNTGSVYALTSGGTLESWSNPHNLVGDTNEDGIVNGQDIAEIASHWLQTGNSVLGDANNDEIVNGQDIAAIASNWLKASNSVSAATLGQFSPGSTLVVDGAGSALLLDKAGQVVYRFLDDSQNWSNLGNWPGSSTLVVDWAGTALILDTGDGWVYGFSDNSNAFSKIGPGPVGAGSTLVVDGAGSALLLEGSSYCAAPRISAGGTIEPDQPVAGLAGQQVVVAE